MEGRPLLVIQFQLHELCGMRRALTRKPAAQYQFSTRQAHTANHILLVRSGPCKLRATGIESRASNVNLQPRIAGKVSGHPMHRRTRTRQRARADMDPRRAGRRRCPPASLPMLRACRLPSNTSTPCLMCALVSASLRRSVNPTLCAIIPAAVGVDIGCGTMAAETTLLTEDLPDNLAPLRSAMAGDKSASSRWPVRADPPSHCQSGQQVDHFHDP